MIACAAEFSPSRRRALILAAVASGFPLGAALGGIPSIFLVTRFDWPSVFILGGVAAFMLLPFLYWGIPDSPSFLMRSKAPAEDVRRALRSEEHTSELQSLMRISYAVFCLKKKTRTHTKR